MIVTIDGPSGTGKTSIAKRVAKELGFIYFDTGAMYRSFTWYVLKNNVDVHDERAVCVLLDSFNFTTCIQDDDTHYLVNEQDVTEEIRTNEITQAVSPVAAMKVVREAMWEKQRAYAQEQSSIFDGRDMGSVVFPHADVKVFLDARPKVRAQRRLSQLQNSHPQEADKYTLESMEEELLRRDQYDAGRKTAPLVKPKGAKVIDTTNLSLDEVTERIANLCRKQAKKLAPSWLRSRSMKFFYRFVLFSSWCFFKLFHRYKVYGLEHFVHRAAIIAPNHTSYFDPPIVSTSWPEEVHFLAKKELFEPILFGRMIRSLNSHPVHGDVADVGVFKTILRLLKEGKQIVLFPEGGRTDGNLEPIKPGIGMLLVRSKAAIVPTYIHGADKVWGRNRKLPKLFGRVACVFGSAILYESFAHLDKKTAQEEIAKCLTEAILGLKQWLEEGAKGTPP